MKLIDKECNGDPDCERAKELAAKALEEVGKKLQEMADKYKKMLPESILEGERGKPLTQSIEKRGWHLLVSDETEHERNKLYKKMKIKNNFNCSQLEKGKNPDSFLRDLDFSV